MSFRYLELFANLEVPNEWTTLDRLNFVWHCNRHDERKGKAWPSEAELAIVTGANRKSISRSRGRLVKSGALFRVTKACEGRRAEYAVVETWLLSNQRVTDGLPVNSNGLHTDTEQVTEQDLLGNSSALSGLLVGNPKPIKPISKRSKRELFDEFASGLKDQSLIPYIEAGSNLDDLLKRVIQQDTNFKAFHDYLGLQSFARSEKIGGLLIHFLKQYLATIKAKSEAGLGEQFVTRWCGECNEITRTRSEVFIDSEGWSVNKCCICNPVGIELYRHVASKLEPENKTAYIERVKSVGGAVFL